MSREEGAVLRSALRKELNPGEHAGELDEEEVRAISWIARASRQVGSLGDPAVVCDILDVLTVNLNGKPAAPEYFSRRRRVMHRALAYAVRKKRLTVNPLSKANLPEGWTPPEAPDDILDPGRWVIPRWSRRCSKHTSASAGGRAGGLPRSTAACSTP